MNAVSPRYSTVTAIAPVRICDVGGWTDTWFGSPGQVCSLAAGPGVTATATVSPNGSGPPVHLIAPDIGVDHRFGPDPERGWDAPSPSLEPLLEHAVADVLADVDPSASHAIRVTVDSAVPPGASLGTSASAVVAVIAAVRGLFEGEAPDRSALARVAHRVETSRAGRQAGVQDHWAAAQGGALHLVIDTYPDVRSLPLEVAPGLLSELGRRVVTVALGTHDSSAVHEEVIRAFLTCDGVEHDRVRRAGRELAALAAEAARALAAGDIDRWAEVLVRSTDAQSRMHGGLVGSAHREAIEVARSSGALGWKVNGAGGDGGSLSIVAAPDGADQLRNRLAATGSNWQVLDLAPIGTGVTVAAR